MADQPQVTKVSLAVSFTEEVKGCSLEKYYNIKLIRTSYSSIIGPTNDMTFRRSSTGRSSIPEYIGSQFR
jgi:hypothetical protein